MTDTKPASCPICLGPPVAAKVSKCGHVFCWPCILHYIQLGERAWRKCPICYDSIYAKDLKCVSLSRIHDLGKPTVENPKPLKMYLMKRKSQCVVALPRIGYHTWQNENELPPYITNSYAFPFAKLLLVSADHMKTEVYGRDAKELAEMMKEAAMDDANIEPKLVPNPIPGLPPITAYLGSMSSEAPFIEMALKEIKQKAEKIDLNGGVSQDEGLLPPGCRFKNRDNTSPRSASPRHRQPSVASSANSPASRSPEADVFYYYQSNDGQHLYLHPLDIKILKYEFGDYSAFPDKIEIDVIHIQESTVDEDLRKWCRYLNHLPLGCDLGFCHVDLKGVVSEETLKLFESMLFLNHSVYLFYRGTKRKNSEASSS